MDNNTPVAPTDAPAPASVASTNTNEQTPAAPPVDAPVAQTAPTEPTAEQIAKYLGTNVEGLEKAKKFYENNGGFDKVFGERKKEITTPQAQQPVQQPAPVVDGQPLTNPQQPSDPNMLNMDVIQGAIVKDFFKDLAAKPEYANIADKLVDGTVMEQASKMFGINPIANGQINTKQLTDFADMYSKTMPAAPAQAPMTNTPIVQPTAAEFTGPINSFEDAAKVLQEHNAMVASGRGEHPKFKEVSDFLNAGFKSRHPQEQQFEPWAARKARMQKQ